MILSAPQLLPRQGVQPDVLLPEDFPPEQETFHAADFAAPRLDHEQIAFLLQRGQDLISEGNVAAARVALRLAAQANNARAAITLGATYDPAILGVLSAQGIAPDLSLARFWYTRASQLGSQEAQERLNLLGTR